MFKKFLKSISRIAKRLLKSSKLYVRLIDYVVKKDELLWVFPQCYVEKGLKENTLAVLDALVKQNSNIRICVLYYSNTYKQDKQRQEYLKYSNVNYVDIMSLRGLYILMQAKNIFVSHGHHDLYWKGIYADKHNVVNVWHGIPIKGIRHTSKEVYRKAFLEEEDRTNSFVVASSEVDQVKMQNSFNMHIDKVLITGLPRNDFLHCTDAMLPQTLLQQQSEIKEILAGRKLVLFAPTWRNTKGSDEIKNDFLSHLDFDYGSDMLHKSLQENNMVLGLRLHPNIKNQKYHHDNVINLSSSIFPSTQVILRNTEILITDYSSIWIDFIQLRRKVIGYFPDHEHYLKNDRELLYDLETVFPGDIFTEFSALVNYFNDKEAIKFNERTDKYEASLALFHKYNDTNNAKRLIEKLS